jgi:CMP-N-acetylneuraminic acid synthetase/quercetin dioxygenase-like cupin family protein
MKIICMIPARIGSTRIKKKNLRFLGDRPLVCHALKTCVDSKLFDAVYVNSESDILKEIAEEYGANFYKRPEEFSESHVTNDLFMEDFLIKHECDYVIQVNPTSPFITEEDIAGLRHLLVEKQFETVQSVKVERIEALYKESSLNYDPKGIMPESQNLEPIWLYSSGIMGFKKDRYLKNMKALGSATYGGNGSIGYHVMKGFSTVDIDYEEDFQFAEIVWAHLNSLVKKDPQYYDESKDHDSSSNLIGDTDRGRILDMDGVSIKSMDEFNKEIVHIPNLIDFYGKNGGWAHTVVDSSSNSATLIAQLPGEGNRRHFHPDWNEWWYIVAGEWEWLIEGKPKRVKAGDLVFIEHNLEHKITAIGDKMAIRLAVSRADVEHVYTQEDYE